VSSSSSDFPRKIQHTLKLLQDRYVPTSYQQLVVIRSIVLVLEELLNKLSRNTSKWGRIMALVVKKQYALVIK
jgi:hypothetical protein